MQIKAEPPEDPIYKLESGESSGHMNNADIKTEMVAEKIKEEELIIKSENGDASDEDM